jgi:hypothetical protein
VVVVEVVTLPAKNSKNYLFVNFWVFFYIDSIPGSSHSVDVGSVATVSEIHSNSTVLIYVVKMEAESTSEASETLSTSKQCEDASAKIKSKTLIYRL